MKKNLLNSMNFDPAVFVAYLVFICEHSRKLSLLCDISCCLQEEITGNYFIHYSS